MPAYYETADVVTQAAVHMVGRADKSLNGWRAEARGLDPSPGRTSHWYVFEMAQAGAPVLVTVGVVRTGGVSPDDIHQRRTIEVAVGEVGARQVRAAEVRSLEVAIREVGLLEILPDSEVRPRARPSWCHRVAGRWGVEIRAGFAGVRCAGRAVRTSRSRAASAMRSSWC